ncbi:MAG: PTS sugar transporter subunit IIB [Desulfurococcaceae archaeon]
MNLKIVVVCGFGLGSSELLLVNIDKVLKSLGLKNYHLEASSLALTGALDADMIVTSGIFVKDIKERLKGKEIPIVSIKSFVNLDEIREKLTSALKEMKVI